MNEVRLTTHKWKWIGLLVVTLVAAGLLSPWASSHPDNARYTLDRFAYWPGWRAWFSYDDGVSMGSVTELYKDKEGYRCWDQSWRRKKRLTLIKR
jgi:hypothetical protein